MGGVRALWKSKVARIRARLDANGCGSAFPPGRRGGGAMPLVSWRPPLTGVKALRHSPPARQRPAFLVLPLLLAVRSRSHPILRRTYATASTLGHQPPE